MDNFSEIDKIYHQISSSHTRDLIRHFMYSIKDINSYDELTEEEKKIVSEDTYNKFRVVKPITIEELQRILNVTHLNKGK